MPFAFPVVTSSSHNYHGKSKMSNLPPHTYHRRGGLFDAQSRWGMKGIFAQRLLEAMDAKGIKRKELAHLLWDKPGAVDDDTIGRYLRGETKNPPAKTLILLAEVLQRSTDWLLGKDESPTHSGVRVRGDKVFAGFLDFRDHSPLFKDISEDEIRALLSIDWPPHKEPTRQLYEKVLIDMRAELRDEKPRQSKRGKR